MNLIVKCNYCYMEPIKINVEDNRKHTQIAFFIDDDRFTKDILYYRQKWLQVNKPFLSRSFEEWFDSIKDKNKTRDELLRKDKEIEKMSLIAKDLNKQGKGGETERVVGELQTLFRKLPNLDFKGDIEEILIRFGIPSLCFKAIARALISNEINDSDWQFYDVILEPPHFEPDLRTPSRIIQEPYCAIILTPYLNKTQLGEIFERNKNKIVELYENSRYRYRTYSSDTVTNIKRDRNWYWLNKNGMSYTKILNEVEHNRGITWGGISQAIRQYKRNLRKNIDLNTPKST